MMSEHERFAAFRRDLEKQERDIACSTDPAWMRDRFGIHQFSPIQIVGIAALGLVVLLACSVVW